MSRKKPNLVFIIWDIGRGSKAVVEDGETLLDQHKKFLKELVINKLLFEPIDQIAILKNNSKKSEHPSSVENFPNIFYEADGENDKLEILNLVDQTQPTNLDNECLGALCVALSIIKEKISNLESAGNSKAKKPQKVFESIKLIVLSSLDCGTYNRAETKTITKHLKSLNIFFVAIGKSKDAAIKVEFEKEPDLKYIDQCPETFDAETAINLMFSYVHGIYWDYKEALMNQMSNTSRKVAPRNTKIPLEFGSKLKINVMYFNEIQEEARLEFKVLHDSDMSKKSGIDRVYTTQGGKRKMVDDEELISGFKFGTSIIPFSEEDKKALEYKSGPKCLKILYFCKQKLINHMFTGKSTVNIFAEQNDKFSVVAFSGLVKAMKEKQVAAIVRRVAMNNGKLQLGALMPRINADEDRLVFTELPFFEDSINYKFNKTKQDVTDEQTDAIRELVKNMDLMESGPSGSLQFEMRSTPDPSKVYMKQLIMAKAQNQDALLEPPSKTITSLLDRPTAIAEKAAEMDEKLSAVFTIAAERVSLARAKIPRVPRAPAATGTGNNMDVDLADVAGSQDLAAGPADAAAQSATLRIVQMGSVTPAEDFQALIQQGLPLDEVCKQCQSIVLQLAFRLRNDLHKPLTAVRVMRSECVKSNPALYNDWLPILRQELAERNELALWLMIMNDTLGPITREENPDATVDQADALRFLADPPPQSQTQGMDIDDLLDDM